MLSDPFITHFLPALSAPHLAELRLCMLGLTPACLPAVTSYISDASRCRALRTLSLNGNSLGWSGVEEVFYAVEKSNWGLMTLDLYSNSSGDPGVEEMMKWLLFTQRLNRVLFRNQLLRNQVEAEALALLLPARALLLPPHLTSSSSSPLLTLTPTTLLLPLPAELYLYILPFLAPSLSPAQRARVYAYAASYATLPPLLPRLIAASPSPAFGRARLRASVRGIRATRGGKGAVRQRGEPKERWLALVGCEVYEPV